MSFLAQLRSTAQVLAAEEQKLQRATRAKLAAMEERRRQAHRRLHLLAAMAAAAMGEREAAIAAAVARFETETGLKPNPDVRAELAALAAEIHGALHGNASADPIARFAALEAWYRQRFNRDLLALMDPSEEHFSPPVDF